MNWFKESIYTRNDGFHIHDLKRKYCIEQTNKKSLPKGDSKLLTEITIKFRVHNDCEENSFQSKLKIEF